MNGNLPTGGTPETGDVTAGLSEAVIEADTGKKGIPPIDAGTAAVDYAAQQNAVPASVVHVDFRGEAARKAAVKVEARPVSTPNLVAAGMYKAPLPDPTVDAPKKVVLATLR
jgi:hypothetical protein